MHFIFEVRVKPGYTAEQYADAWVHASKIIQQAPGARGTRLHRKIGDPNVLIAIATWESKAQRDAMEGNQNDLVGDHFRTRTILRRARDRRVRGCRVDRRALWRPHSSHNPVAGLI